MCPQQAHAVYPTGVQLGQRECGQQPFGTEARTIYSWLSVEELRSRFVSHNLLYTYFAFTNNSTQWTHGKQVCLGPSRMRHRQHLPGAMRVYLRSVLQHRGRGECQVLCCCLTENKASKWHLFILGASCREGSVFSTALTCQLLNK